jgi:hypothetical protein
MRHQSDDFSRLGVTAERALGKDEMAVDRHLEHPSGRRHQPNVSVRIQLLQLIHQTGGSRLVVSDDAILDHHAHVGLLPIGTVARIVAVPGDAAKGGDALVTRLLVRLS